ncbi:MAG: NAD-dependent epimerase/dehydratase family protein [bacterium]|nr:NAD-dependent epimerase/dehydratase family protein [bacterium]
MIALVTGGNGFVGSHLVERLLGEGYTVRCVLREGSDHRWLEGLGIERVYGSYSNPDTTREAAVGVDVTFHLAAATKASSMEDFRRINVEGTRNLVEAVSEVASGSRFVFASSLAAAGPSAPNTPRNEEAAQAPVSDYGRSKLEAEKVFTEGDPDLSWMIVRPSAVYGPREKDILSFIRVVCRGLLPQVGFGRKYLNAVYVSDLVDIIIRAAEQKLISKEIYFAAHPEIMDYRDFGAAIAGALGKRKYFRLVVPVPLLYAAALLSELRGSIAGKVPALNRQKAREMAQSHWTCDTSKAKRHLDFEAEVDIGCGMEMTVEWYIKNGWL